MHTAPKVLNIAKYSSITISLFQAMKEHQAIHKFKGDSCERRSARVFPTRENKRSDDVLDAATLSRHERLWQAFSTLCPCWTSMPTSHSQIRRPFQHSFRRNNIHPCGNPAFVRSTPAVFLQHSYPYPRETRRLCRPHPRAHLYCEVPIFLTIHSHSVISLVIHVINALVGT